MNLLKKFSRSRSIRIITKLETGDLKSCLAATLSVSFPDEKLEKLKSMTLAYRKKGVDRRYQDEDERNLVDFMSDLRDFIKEKCSSGPEAASLYLERINLLSTMMSRIVLEHGDRTEPGYLEALMATPNIIFHLHRNIVDREPISDEQAETLLAVSFIQEQRSNRESFFPQLPPAGVDGNHWAWLTRSIMESPSAPEVHAAEYQRRLSRSRDIGTDYGHYFASFGAMCDYPDDLLHKLLTIHSNNPTLWFELESHVLISEHATTSRMREFLYFMTQNYGDSETTLLAPSALSLHSYEVLPRFDDYSDAPSDVRELCTALILVNVVSREVTPIEDPSHEMAPRCIITDRDLLSIVEKEYKQAHRIVDIIRDRGTTDTRIICMALGNGNVLDDGVL